MYSYGLSSQFIDSLGCRVSAFIWLFSLSFKLNHGLQLRGTATLKTGVQKHISPKGRAQNSLLGLKMAYRGSFFQRKISNAKWLGLIGVEKVSLRLTKKCRVHCDSNFFQNKNEPCQIFGAHRGSKMLTGTYCKNK